VSLRTKSIAEIQAANTMENPSRCKTAKLKNTAIENKPTVKSANLFTQALTESELGVLG